LFIVEDERPQPLPEGFLMSGHIFKIGFASQAKLKKQKNGGPKNSDQPAAGLHFSARHFSAASVRVPGFYKCVLTSALPV
jgi:hypothetical protein